MLDIEWINDNLIITNEDEINWGKGIYTPVSSFLEYFGEIIRSAILIGEDVRKAISDSDSGRGFSELILSD